MPTHTVGGRPACVTAMVICSILLSSIAPFRGTSDAQGGDGALPREAAAPTWPMFRGGPARTGLSPFDTAGNTGGLLWECKLGGIMYSSPAIGADGTAYVGCSDHNLTAVRPDGTVAWKFLTGSDIDASPAIAPNGTIYVGSDKLYAVAPGGSLKWSFSTLYGMDSSPVVGPDGRIYFGTTEGTLYCLAPDGRLSGSFDASRQISSSPALDADGNIYFGSYDGHVYSISPDMSLRWSFKTGDYVSATPAIGPDGTTYVGSKDGYLYAITGAGALKWSYYAGRQLFSSVAISPGGTLYVGCFNKNVYAIGPGGALLWSFATDGWVDSSPSVGADGAIFVGSGDGSIYALYPNGTLKWAFQTGGEIFSSPAICANGSVIFGSWDKKLYCVGSPFSRPSPPRDLSAVLGDRQVELRWYPPASDGGKPVTAYRVYRGSAPSGGMAIATLQGDVMNFNDTDIIESRVYYYRVTALTSIGESLPSNEVNLTAMFRPTPPRYLRTTPGDTSVRLDWDPPASTGGSPLLFYRLYCSPVNGTGGQLAGAEVHGEAYRQTGLVNLVTYSYEVSAVNAIGESDRSNTATATPRPPATGVPSPPLEVRTRSWDGAVDIFWAVPADDGGHPVTGYRVYRDLGSGALIRIADLVAGNLTFRDWTVVNGLTYWYYMTAINKIGESDFSQGGIGQPLAGLADRQPPQIWINEPVDGSGAHSSKIRISGQARDNSSVVAVELSRDGQKWSRANGTSNWSGDMTLSPGWNTVFARATDGWNNNATARVMVKYEPASSSVGTFNSPLLIAIVIVVLALEFALVAVRRWRRSPKR